MKSIIIILVLIPSFGLSQSPQEAPLPEKFNDLANVIHIDHYPSPVFASTDPDEPGTYFWKHTTTFFSPAEDIFIEEGGAYIFYNNKWNLRVAMSKKEISKYFDIPQGIMKAGEPYAFVKNWRRDSRLAGGWAMWYIMGKTSDGRKVFGVGKLDTVGKLYSEEK